MDLVEAVGQMGQMEREGQAVQASQVVEGELEHTELVPLTLLQENVNVRIDVKSSKYFILRIPVENEDWEQWWTL